MQKVSLEYINTRKERMVVIAEKTYANDTIYRVRSKKGSTESLSTWFESSVDGDLCHMVASKGGTQRNMYVGKLMRIVPVAASVPMTLPQRVAYSDPDKTIVR